MPITARLSRKFYDLFGDDVVNEMVDLLNNMDSTYRTELREQNELNFARFDAGVGERLAELKGELRGEIATLGAELRAELSSLAAELRAEMSSLATELRAEMSSLAAELRAEMSSLDSNLRTEIARQGESLREEITRQTRWLVGLWAVQMMAFVGTVLAVLQAK